MDPLSPGSKLKASYDELLQGIAHNRYARAYPVEDTLNSTSRGLTHRYIQVFLMCVIFATVVVLVIFVRKAIDRTPSTAKSSVPVTQAAQAEPKIEPVTACEQPPPSSASSYPPSYAVGRPLTSPICSVCYGSLQGACPSLPCGHTFHLACLKFQNVAGFDACPICPVGQPPTLAAH